MNRKRSRGREVALQLLFQHEFNPAIKRADIERFVDERLDDVALEAFSLALYDGVLANIGGIDERLTSAAENWRLSRMAFVDRNVLRLGAFELMHTPDTPVNVVLDEAIELARGFG